MMRILRPFGVELFTQKVSPSTILVTGKVLDWGDVNASIRVSGILQEIMMRIRRE